MAEELGIKEAAQKIGLIDRTVLMLQDSEQEAGVIGNDETISLKLKLDTALEQLLEMELQLSTLPEEEFRREWYMRGRRAEFARKYWRAVDLVLQLDEEHRKNSEEYSPLPAWVYRDLNRHSQR